MKVVGLKTHLLGYDFDKPWGSARVWFQRMRVQILELITDEGLVGWAPLGGPSTTVARAAVHALASAVIGQDPFQSEVIWGEMYHRVKDFGTMGPMIHAIGAIDTALWDLKGKALGRPIYQLLGGRVRERVPAYATGFYFTHDPDQVAAAVDEARRFREQGFRAMKIKLGLGLKEDIARVRAVRRELGDDVALMTDASRAYNMIDALRLGRMLEELDVRWFEEPISPEDLDGYVELCRALDIPIAGGEAEYTKFGFRDLIVRRAHDVIQPEIGKCGGFTEVKKIVALAEAWYQTLIPHVGFNPIETAEALQLLANMPDLPPALHPSPPYLEVLNVHNPLREALFVEPPRMVDGFMEIPSGPGLGVEIDRTALERFRVDD